MADLCQDLAPLAMLSASVRALLVMLSASAKALFVILAPLPLEMLPARLDAFSAMFSPLLDLTSIPLPLVVGRNPISL